MTGARLVRSTLLSILSIAVLGLGACRTAHEPGAPAAIDDGLDALGWMAGSWSGEHGETRVEESWTEPRGGTMLGTGRVTKSGRTLFFEFLRIEVQGGAVTYLAMPQAQPETPFTLSRSGEREVVFENLAHDDPVRIAYRLEPSGELVARTERRDGRGEEFRMRRGSQP